MPSYVYVALAGEDRIATWTLDARTGAVAHLRDTPLAGGPSPLAVDPSRRTLYCGLRASCHIASLRIDPSDGGLSPAGKIALDADPCFLATDRRGRYLLSAYYRAGCVAVHAIERDATVRRSPVEWRSTAPCAHALQVDRSNRYAFVPHVAGSNAIWQFRFDPGSGRLEPNDVARVEPAPGTGPRHYCFHPALDVVYFDNEQASSVTAYRLDPSSGTLAPFQTLPTLPPDYTGDNTCAQIHIAPAGDYLYVANRGHDSIAGFALDGSGRMSALGQQRTQPTPRAFNVDPSGRYLLAAGLDSGVLSAYRIAPGSGTLSLLGEVPVGRRPMWVEIVDLG